MSFFSSPSADVAVMKHYACTHITQRILPEDREEEQWQSACLSFAVYLAFVFFFFLLTHAVYDVARKLCSFGNKDVKARRGIFRNFPCSWFYRRFFSSLLEINSLFIVCLALFFFVFYFNWRTHAVYDVARKLCSFGNKDVKARRGIFRNFPCSWFYRRFFSSLLEINSIKLNI